MLDFFIQTKDDDIAVSGRTSNNKEDLNNRWTWSNPFSQILLRDYPQ